MLQSSNICMVKKYRLSVTQTCNILFRTRATNPRWLILIENVWAVQPSANIHYLTNILILQHGKKSCFDIVSACPFIITCRWNFQGYSSYGGNEIIRTRDNNQTRAVSWQPSSFIRRNCNYMNFFSVISNRNMGN